MNLVSPTQEYYGIPIEDDPLSSMLDPLLAFAIVATTDLALMLHLTLAASLCTIFFLLLYPIALLYQTTNAHVQGSDRKILLQNENGPCPLLAAANALLLRGAIALPSVCIRSGCASLEDVVNMLAEKAMNYNHGNGVDDSTNKNETPDKEKPTTANTENPSGDDKESDSHQRKDFHVANSEQYVNEVLNILPKLQYGMDVNPKFTNGPTGMEFTSELTTFDLLNVKLVHGWLLDPQSDELMNLIGSKTYNELVEAVISGSEASVELQTLEAQIEKLRDCSDDVWIDMAVPADETEDGEKPKSTRQSVGELRKEFQGKQEELSKRATVGSLIQNFLDHTSHQLTQYGLSVLYQHLAENEMVVFFRNNHFCTLTKHEGLLYLLVTDLGYANVPNIVWEKMDVIDGDTEYVDAGFSRPSPHAELSAEHQSSEGFGNMDPDQMLAQRGQSEMDYQLALQLSGNSATSAPGGNGFKSTGNQSNFDEQEGNLMAAATEASLRTFNGVDDGIGRGQNQPQRDVHTTQEDHDHLLAMQMQAQMEQQDMIAAQEMQAAEWNQQRRNNETQRATTASAGSGAKNSGCVIS